MSLPVVLLAGGLGTRLREETDIKPKPMVEIGEYPILWHIMKIFSHFQCREYVICLGYKGGIIKDFFRNYRTRESSFSIDLSEGKTTLHSNRPTEDWVVHLLDTGAETMTGGRIKRASEFLGDRPFLATYGDGVANIDITKLLDSHKESGAVATITAVRPPARFGGLRIDNGRVTEFVEKPQIGEGWINGGFMVLEPQIRERIEQDSTIFERYPLESLAREGQLNAYAHDGFWQCVDTVRDLTLLRDLWNGGHAPWRVWQD